MDLSFHQSNANHSHRTMTRNRNVNNNNANANANAKGSSKRKQSKTRGSNSSNSNNSNGNSNDVTSLAAPNQQMKGILRLFVDKTQKIMNVIGIGIGIGMGSVAASAYSPKSESVSVSASDLYVQQKKNKEEIKKCVYPCFMNWSFKYVMETVMAHRLVVFMACSMLFFIGVEYTLTMVASGSSPYDLGFVLTRRLHAVLVRDPTLNSFLAGLNTVFVLMQVVYILWAWFVEGRGRPAVAAMFMFTCRGIMGYTTQLPLPTEFLGSGADFPVGNVSFFLFFSGHVGGAVIASLDMRRMKRNNLAFIFDACNILQSLRLLASRGHYTIDLAAGAAAGWLFDTMAAMYLESNKFLHSSTAAAALEYQTLIHDDDATLIHDDDATDFASPKVSHIG